MHKEPETQSKLASCLLLSGGCIFNMLLSYRACIDFLWVKLGVLHYLVSCWNLAELNNALGFFSSAKTLMNDSSEADYSCVSNDQYVAPDQL